MSNHRQIATSVGSLQLQLQFPGTTSINTLLVLTCMLFGMLVCRKTKTRMIVMKGKEILRYVGSPVPVIVYAPPTPPCTPLIG